MPSTAGYIAHKTSTVNHKTPIESYSAKTTLQPHLEGNRTPKRPLYTIIVKERGSTSRKDDRKLLKAKRAITTALESL